MIFVNLLFKRGIMPLHSKNYYTFWYIRLRYILISSNPEFIIETYTCMFLLHACVYMCMVIKRQLREILVVLDCLVS